MIGDIDLSKVTPHKPKLSLCKPDSTRTTIAILKEAYDEQQKIRLGNINELTFKIPYERELQHNLTTNSNVDLISARKLIKFEKNGDIEYYTITKISDVMDDNADYKQIECMSLGFELSWKLIRGYDEISKTATELLTAFLAETSWTIGTVSSDFDTMRRSPTIDSATVLESLFNLATTFDALIQFDTVTREISFVKLTDISMFKGLKVNYGHLMRGVEQENDLTEFCTRLKCYGKDNVTISSVNATGAVYIESYSYFLYPFQRDGSGNVLSHSNFMSDSLCNAILDYEQLIEDNADSYQTLLASLASYEATLTSQQNTLTTLNNDLKVVEDQLAVANATGASNTTILANKTAKESEITSQNALISATQASITSTNTSISNLADTLSIDNNFTTDQQTEWNYYINEREYKNDLITDPQELLDLATAEFEKIREPKILVNVSIVDFLECIDQQQIWDKLSIGDEISVYHEKLGIDIRATLTEIDQNYESADITITIANVKEIISDETRTIKKLYDSISTSTTVDINKYGWTNAVADVDALNVIIDNPWDATTRTIKGGVSESVEISHRGIILYDPDDVSRDVILQHGIIALSKDGGNNWSTAITADGVVADRLYGTILAGTDLTITNTAGTVTVNGDGMTVTDMDLTLTRSDNKSRILMNPTDGIKIQAFDTTWVDKLYADVNGDLTLDGNIIARGGTIGGWTINSSSLSGSGLISGGVIEGSTVRTAGSSTYPRIELTSTDNILTAYTSSSDYIRLKPDVLSGTSFEFNNGFITTTLMTIHTGINDTFRVNSGDKLLLQATNDIQLSPGGQVQLTDWTKLYSINDSKTLQQALDAKLNGTFISGTVYVASTLGGAIDTAISFVNGVRTS